MESSLTDALSTTSSKVRNNNKAAVYLLLSVITFSFHYCITKYLVEFYSITIAIQMLCLAFFYIPYSYSRIRNSDKTISDVFKQSLKYSTIFLFRIILSTGSEFSSIAALNNMRINTSITIMYTYPLWATLFSNLYYRIPFKKRDIVVTCISFAGAVLILKPFFPSPGEDSMVGFFFSMLSALQWGLMPLITKMASDIYSNDQIIFFAGFANILLSPVIWCFETHNEQFGLSSISLLFFHGLTGLAGMWFFLHAFTIGDTSKIVSLEYLMVVLSFLYNSLIFDRTSSTTDIIGSLLIVTSNIYKIVKDNQ